MAQIHGVRQGYSGNVLLIAPNVGLEKATEEARAVASSLGAFQLVGKVDRDDVLSAIEQNRRQWDIIWFATHGTEKGVELSDGTLPTDELVALVRNTQAELVVINTCSSRYIGLELHDELGVSVICTQTDAGDLKAYQTGRLLASNLAHGMPVRQAFDRSKPGNNLLYYLFEGTKRANEAEGDRDSEILNLVRSEFSNIYRALDDFKGEVSARLSEMQSELDGRISSAANESRGIDRRVFAIEAVVFRASPTEKWAVGVFFAIVLFMFLVYLWNTIQ